MSAPGYYKKPEVLAEIPPDRHAVLEASAGTGKTYALEHLVAELIVSGRASVEQLLIVTFTEKAAAELRARVRKLLEKLVATTSPMPAGADPGDYWCLDEPAQNRLNHALRRFDSAAICTIHSFCRQALSEHAFANRRLFDEELVDQGEQFAAAFREVLRVQLATDQDLGGWLKLWKESGRSIAGLQELLEACSKLGGRVVPEWSPKQIDEAFDGLPQLEEALEIAQDVGRSDVVGRTRLALELVYASREAWRNSVGDRQLGRYAALGGLDQVDPRISATMSAIRYAQEKLEQVAVKASKAEEQGKEPPATKRPEAVALLAEKLAALRAVAPGIEPLLAQLLLPRVEARLVERKRQAGLFDFGDMLSLVAESLAPEGSPLLAALRQRFRYALIDEFQDTDEKQWRIFRRIFFEGDAGHVLYLIGDPKQAIYRFRGADVDTYLAAKREVLGDRAPVYLERNFRSTQALIDGYNEILDQKAAEPFFKGEDIRYDRPVECGKTDFKLVDPEAPAPIHVYVTNSSTASADAVLPELGRVIASEIRRLVSPRAPKVFLQHGKAVRRELEYRDIYVLASTGKELKLVSEQLREEGIPFAFYKQGGLFQTVEARHLEALLAAIAAPDNRARRFGAWLTPFFGLQLKDLRRGADVPESDPLVARLREWSRLAEDRNYQRLFRLLLEDSGLTRRLIVFDKGERALTNYLQLLEFLRESFASRGATVGEMSQGLASLRQEAVRPQAEDAGLQRLETERDAVQLLSMHMSKGLEAPVVFLAGGFSSGAGNGALSVMPVHLPHGADPTAPRERALLVGRKPEAWAAQAELEEAREEERLLYVAMTRAAARLYLPFVGTKEPLAEEGEPAASGDGPGPKMEFIAASRANGRYRQVNERLLTLLNEMEGEACRDSIRELFLVKVMEAPRPGSSFRPAVVPAPFDTALLDAPAEDGWRAARERHAGFITTSFSGMQRSMHAMEEDAEQTKAETFDRVMPKPDELPGGASSGSYLHELLAATPLEIARTVKSPGEFVAHAEVKELFESLANRFGIAAQHQQHALQLTHAALRAPLDLGGSRLDGIASADRVLREMEFLYPIPEQEHPRLEQAHDEGRRPFEIRRGFVVGFIDLIFEHQGRTYFGDWKSNCLPGFEGEALEAGFKPYEWQARLYTLALAKMLRLRSESDFEARFGGSLFLFLRGMRADGKSNEGVVFRRPSWAEVCGWERELFERGDLMPRGVA